MKPSRPEVVSGVSRSDGSAATISAAIRSALTELAGRLAGMDVDAVRP